VSIDPEAPDDQAGDNGSVEDPEEATTSDHLVQMVDILFALVLGQGVATFHNVVVPHFTGNLPVLIAVVAIYFTIVRSFVAWHEAMAECRYRILTLRCRTTELWRLYIDALIVALYAYMWFATTPLKSNSATDIHRLLWAFPLLFLMYGVWGQLRRVAWGDDKFSFIILGCFGVSYLLLAIAYTITRSKTTALDSTTANSSVLALVLFLMLSYRYINFWQGGRYGTRTRTRRFKFLPRPQLPVVRALKRKDA
jgi:succinate-acetate transporter protein